MLGFVERGKPENMQKNVLELRKNQLQTLPTEEAGSGNQTSGS